MLQIQIADPQPRRLTYVVEGEVEKVVTIRPKIVKLEGKAGQEIRQTVEIIPEDKYAFSIVGVEAKNAEYIRYRLEPVEKDGGRKSFVLTVENQRTKIGRFFDRITLKTDSPIKPEIAIGVFGFIKG